MDEKNILVVSLYNDDKDYRIHVAKGASVSEVIFTLSVVIKCLIRDEYVSSKEEALEMLNKYLTDEQYSELKEETK